MDFSNKIKELSERIKQNKDNINTEEATKTSFVLPFFQILGYDIFNPMEFVPEFTADTGIKKGEKVDYAIMYNGTPIMIMEIKSIGTTLEQKHINQLFRYFTVTKARFGILTNGVEYRFYSDLDEPNKMDLMPFFTMNLLDYTAENIAELNKFRKEIFNQKDILDSANDLKYISLLKLSIEEQFKTPSDQFVKALIKNFYQGTKTQNVMDKFKQLTLKALDEYTTDMLNKKLQTAMRNIPVSMPAKESKQEKKKNNPEKPSSKVDYEFLPEELATLEHIKSLLNVDDVHFKKVSQYAYIYRENTTRWFARVFIQQKQKYLVIRKFENTKYETDYCYNEPSDLDVISTIIRIVYNKV